MENTMPSKRAQLHARMGEYLNDIGLNEVYGVISSLQGRVRTLTFCKAKMLDATINIYGERFIQIKWNTTIGALPQRSSVIFDTEDRVKDFLQAAFVDFDFEKADAIPNRYEILAASGKLKPKKAKKPAKTKAEETAANQPKPVQSTDDDKI